MSNKFIKFSKDFMYVMEDNGDKVDVPSFVAKAFNRHRYDIDKKELQVKCINCNTWFTVMINHNGKFEEITDNVNMKKVISRDKKNFYFSNRCNKCSKEKVANQKVVKEIIIEKNKKYSLYLKPSNKDYLDLVACAYGIDIAEALNKLIEKNKTTDSIENLKKQFSRRVDNNC